MDQARRYGRSGVLLFALALMGTVPAASKAAFLSDNLSATTGGTEAASGATWLTSSFGTDSSSYTLNSATLLLANTIPGQATLDLYSDGGLQPGSLLGTLSSPGGYSSTLADTTFTASGITLASNSTYWVVLRATSGAFDWAWSADNTGSGVGFQNTWGVSQDAGSTWFTFDIYPTKMSVVATAAGTAVPEPSSIALLAIGAVGILLQRRWRSRPRPASQPSPPPRG